MIFRRLAARLLGDRSELFVLYWSHTISTEDSVCAAHANPMSYPDDSLATPVQVHGQMRPHATMSPVRVRESSVKTGQKRAPSNVVGDYGDEASEKHKVSYRPRDVVVCYHGR